MKRWKILLFACVFILSSAGQAAAQPQGTPPPERGIPPGWNAEHVDAPPTFSNIGQRSLGRGPDGVMHLAYGGDHLYYAHTSGSTWTTPVVVDPEWGVGQATSLAIDSNNKVHISYFDAVMGALRYATNKNGSWKITILDSSGVGPSIALALDTSGHPHIVYQRISGAMGYKYQLADGTWSGDPGYVLGYGGSGVSLAIGSNNHLHVSWYTKVGVDACMNYATSDEAGTWSYPAPSFCRNTNDMVPASSLALDSSNRPYIIFLYSGTLYLWYESSIGWIDPAYVTTSVAGPYFSMAIDSADLVHIAYQKTSSLAYSRRSSGGSWSSAYGPISQNTGADGFVSLALDASDHPVAAYYREDNRGLSVNTLGSGSWPFDGVLVDSAGAEVGACTSLAAAQDGTVYLTYYSTSQQIKIARRVGATWDLSMPAVAISGMPGCQHSLALYSAWDYPAVAFTNHAGELWYAQYVCTITLHGCDYSWQRTKVADGATVPESVSLAFDSTNHPYISYNQSGYLWLAAYNAGWSTIKVEDSVISGQTSLAIDADDHIHIAYFHNTKDLYYAVKISSWSTEPVDTNSVGPYVSLKLNSLGWPRIAYTGDPSGLRFIAKSVIPAPPYYAWGAVETVQPSILIYSPSLGIDPQNHFYISYNVGENGWLFMAEKSSKTWQNEKIDASRYSGGGDSLSISPLNGRPAISYFDGLNKDVKYIYALYVNLLPVVQK